MKHIYLGLSKRSYLDDNTDYRLVSTEIDAQLTGYLSEWQLKNIKKEINRMQEGKNTRYISREYKVIKRDIFISEKHHEFICEIDDIVILGSHAGKIVSREYDAINDIMYYRTDIVVITEEAEGIEEELVKARGYAIERLQSFYNKHNPHKEDKELIKKSKKGFWQRLFG